MAARKLGGIDPRSGSVRQCRLALMMKTKLSPSSLSVRRRCVNPSGDAYGILDPEVCRRRAARRPPPSAPHDVHTTVGRKEKLGAVGRPRHLVRPEVVHYQAPVRAVEAGPCRPRSSSPNARRSPSGDQVGMRCGLAPSLISSRTIERGPWYRIRVH